MRISSRSGSAQPWYSYRRYWRPVSRGKAVHGRLQQTGKGLVKGIDGFARLEIDVGILRTAAQHRVLGGQGACPVGRDPVRVDHGAQGVVLEGYELGQFVGGAEAVEEVQHRDTAFQAHRLGQQGEVHDLLGRVGTKQGEAGHARRHHVAVVAEDGQGLAGKRTGGDVEYRRRQLAGDLVHIGQHQQQALGGGKGRRQRAGLQGTMDGPGGAALALHFDDARHRAPEIFLAARGPLIGPLAHGRGRGDGIDGDDFVEAVRHQGGGLVAIDDQGAWRGHDSLPESIKNSIPPFLAMRATGHTATPWRDGRMSGEAMCHTCRRVSAAGMRPSSL
jgi:hypothetical protein